MKHNLLSMFIAVVAMTCIYSPMFAQSADNEDEVVKIDQWNRNAYREGEILVKFKANGAVQMKAPRKAKFATSQVNSIDALFAELGVDSVEQLMPMTGHKNVGRRVRAYNGSEVEVKDLSKLYRLTLKAEKAQTLFEAIDQLKAQEEVEFAEPNYIVYTMSLPYDADIPTQDQATYTAEPLYSQQWGIPAINLPALWDMPKKSSKRPVIAILDTGVDIEHPDLAANIWTNTIEANGISGQDDDANGFKDDIHGWSFIDNHSVTGDFNGHGTHCAGIAAAVGDNGIGITGANPDALIMPVTVMQSNGTGDVATIVKGIDYAAANGADVISMSIGHYSYSMAEEQALGRAYANAILVAAAGNDGCCFEDCQSCPSLPMFPAGFTFILGVEATQQQFGSCGYRACFSNYDKTGPIYSSFGENELYNYELQAPGVQILSTFPGGRYKILNGTSMACPLAAGAISRLIQCKEILSQELLFGDLIHTRQNNIDILATYNITDADRHPELALVTANLTDTTAGDGDNRADAGETIEFYPIFKNAWGQAENVRFWIKAGFYNQGDWVWDDTTLIHSLQDTAYFGKPLSSYAKATSLNPYRITISPDCADGRQINMTFFATCDNAVDTLQQHVVISADNKIELGGVYDSTLVLRGKTYTITSNLAILSPHVLIVDSDATLTKAKNVSLSCDTLFLRPGARCIGVRPTGKVFAKGLPNKHIYYETTDSWVRTLAIADTLSYTHVTGFAPSGVIRDCVFEHPDIVITDDVTWMGGDIKSCNFISTDLLGFNGNARLTHCNCYNIFEMHINDCSLEQQRFRFCNLFKPGNSLGYYWSDLDAITYVTCSPNYYASNSEDIIRKDVKDFYSNSGFGIYDLSNRLSRPSAQAHGVVWKVVVDGYDAQDEFNLLPPIGVGQHKCEVYFNRAMNVSITPSVFYGVRPPYTQHQVAENGSWSADSTIYTAYFTINEKSVTDGLNTFYVYGAEDNEHFEILEEKYRFHMEVAAAGSMSTGLMAEAGLGKVTLTWETDEEDFADLLGYNIYRWTQDTIWYNNKKNWRIDTICINSTLIDSQDTAYIDYNVVPGKAYYYVIRQMTTSMSSYDLSNPVVARPLTAIKGDANGSMSVDVADVITEVNYITHQNPQPFIFEAADVNSDNAINIFDVVGTINIIRHPEAQNNAVQAGQALYYIENGILYVESDVVLGGVQFTFSVDSPHTFTTLDALQGFETVSEWTNESSYLFMAYSMSGKTIGVGKNALLQIGDAELTSIALSDTEGHNVNAIPRASTALDGTLFMPCSTKYIQDAHLYIKIGDRIYNAMGTLIK